MPDELLVVVVVVVDVIDVEALSLDVPLDELSCDPAGELLEDEEDGGGLRAAVRFLGGPGWGCTVISAHSISAATADAVGATLAATADAVVTMTATRKNATQALRAMLLVILLVLVWLLGSGVVLL